MNLIASELLNILKRELETYRQTLSLLLREREAIAHTSLDDLLSTNSEKQTLLLAIEDLEKDRKVITKKLGESLGLSPVKITLSLLARQLEGFLAGELKSYQHQLSGLIREVVEINRKNARLLQHGHDITRQLMALLNSQDQLNPTYLPSGAVRSSSLTGYNQWQV